MSHKFTVVVQKEDEWYVAVCIENGVASQGRTMEEAMLNLTEAIELFYEGEELPVVNTQTFITTLEVVM